jgi:hypothetical protein
VRSGHEVFTKPEAVREIIRILRLEQSLSTGSTRRHSTRLGVSRLLMTLDSVASVASLGQ